MSILWGRNLCLLVLLSCSPRSPDWVKLLEPNRILRSGGLWLPKDEAVIIVSVEARINPPYGLLVLCDSIPHQLEVIVGVLEVGFVLVDGFLASLGNLHSYPSHLDP